MTHTNPAFLATSGEQNLAFDRAKGFRVVMVNGPERPLASHVPFLLAKDGRSAELHLTRSNPIAQAGLPVTALLAVSGPDAPHAHADALSAEHEERLRPKKPWGPPKMNEAVMMRMILPFRLQIASVSARGR